MSGRRHIDPVALRKTPGYTHAVVAEGTQVHLTGQVAWDLEGKVVGVGDIDRQLEQTWSNLRALVEAVGATMDDVVKLTTYAVRREDMPAIGAAKRAQFAAERMPASTLVFVAGLADPDLLVEIEAIVVLSDSALENES
ncbi:RidA family protein [Microbacterium sp. NIBRBAC000506063]|uniref:RidA family protein n=1 Tax=Microbacterium sp. NIBRBAC000506063 TaxID=2734618 RepID=UPI001BB62BDD|nr:RidA family protein [Microbacterium sp. NIBRBAC000506063]QTV80429.1 RidA family protein [Microbacterium sp. NIBRBAC000506063]